MGRMATYVVLFSGLLLLFYYGGLLDQSTSTGNLLLSLLLNPQDITISDFINVNIAQALISLGIGGIAIGLIIAGNLDLAVLASVALALLTLLMSFVDVFAVVFNANPIVSTLFLSPWILLMVVTTLEWWRGRD